MNNLLEQHKEGFEKVIGFFSNDINSLRTGRVSPSLVESVKVESYGSMTELLQLASITSPEPHSIVIKPWDKNILAAIEKALSKSDLNVNPVVDGDLIRLNFPPLTEESRKELVKILHKKAEESRVKIKSQREKVKDEILTLEKSKTITEDERFKTLEDLDELVKGYNEKIKQISEKKEEEIMTI